MSLSINQKAPLERELYTVRELEYMLNQSKPTIYRHLRTGALHKVKVGKKTLIPKWSVRRYLEQLEQESGGDAAAT